MASPQIAASSGLPLGISLRGIGAVVLLGLIAARLAVTAWMRHVQHASWARYQDAVHALAAGGLPTDLGAVLATAPRGWTAPSAAWQAVLTHIWNDADPGLVPWMPDAAAQPPPGAVAMILARRQPIVDAVHALLARDGAPIDSWAWLAANAASPQADHGALLPDAPALRELACTLAAEAL